MLATSQIAGFWPRVFAIPAVENWNSFIFGDLLHSMGKEQALMKIRVCHLSFIAKARCAWTVYVNLSL
jgi:hypothetical protein